MTSPTPLTAAEIDAIEARAEGARPGPWSVIDTLDDYPVEYGNHWVVANPEDQEDDTFHVSLDVGAEEDAQFIAHARSDVPALLATIRYLTDCLAAAERERDAAVVEALAVASANDAIRGELHEFRTLAMAREAALTRLADGWRQVRVDVDTIDAYTVTTPESPIATAEREACATELTALLNGGAS